MAFGQAPIGRLAFPGNDAPWERRTIGRVKPRLRIHNHEGIDKLTSTSTIPNS
jgi:hypothetical protein